MQQKNQAFSIKGMQKDLSESVFNSEYAYDIRNMRITPTDDNTGFALVNEKGNKLLNVEGLENGLNGTPIGQCVINNQLVLFCTNNETDTIYLIYKESVDTSTHYVAKELFSGKLNFNPKHPIEAYPFYENEELQKIYWVDGINPFRFINIGRLNGKFQKINTSLINAVPDLQLKEIVDITKNYDSGMFAPGVIQYSFTYIKKYAQESAIFYTSPLYYISYKERGGNGEEKVTNSFSIKVRNLDKNFDYVRVYAMHRTSINAAMNTRKVIDLPIDGDEVFVIDTGTIGDSIADTDLLFKTGEEIIPNTINSKNNTLFLGNIQSNYNSIPSSSILAFQKIVEQMPIEFKNNYAQRTIEKVTYGIDSDGNILPIGENYDGPTVTKDKVVIKNFPYKALPQTAFYGNYQYQHLLDKSSQDIKIFKYLDWYRLGIQIQYKTGKWSDVIYLTDLQNTLQPTVAFTDESDKTSRGNLYTSKDNWFAVPVMTLRNTSVYSEVDEDATNEAWNNIEDSEKDSYDFSGIDDVQSVKTFFNGEGILDYLKSIGAVKIRPVIVYPNYQDRDVICQGIVAPTVYNVNNRYSNAPFSQSSWFTRVNSPACIEDPKQATEPFVFYITVYSCFHSDNSGKVHDFGEDSSYYLEGKDGNNLRVTIKELKGTGVLYGESQRQVKCEVIDTREHIDSWLKTQVDAVWNSVKSTVKRRSKGATKNIEGESYKEYEIDDKILQSYKIEDGKSFQLKNNKNLTIHRYFRWIPFFDGVFDSVDLVHCPGNKNNAAKNRVIGEIDNTGKDSFRCNIGIDKNSVNAYASIALKKKTTEKVEEFKPNTLKKVTNNDYNSAGSYVEFRHNYAIPGANNPNAEIQSIIDPVPTGVKNKTEITSESWRYYNKEYYYVDQNIVTMHSPELEFDTSVQNLDLSNTKLRIVGMVPIVSNQSDISITTDGTPLQKSTNSYINNNFSYNAVNTSLQWSHGLYVKDIQSSMGTTMKERYNAWKIRCTTVSWIDTPFTLKKNFEIKGNTEYELGFVVYPWHRNGALNNDIRPKGESGAWLEHKKMSNLRYSNRSAYFPEQYIWYADYNYGSLGTTKDPRNGTADVQLFNSNEVTPVKIKSQEGKGKIVYYGNVDTMSTISMVIDNKFSGPKSSRNRQEGYPIMAAPFKASAYEGDSNPSTDDKYDFDNITPIQLIKPDGGSNVGQNNTNIVEGITERSSTSCRIKYKSTPHAVISLSYIDDNTSQLILPTFGLKSEKGYYSIEDCSTIEDGYSLWWNDCTKIQQDLIPINYGDTAVPSKDFIGPEDVDGPQYGWVWLGELYKEVNPESRFGGKSIDAIANNKWQPCGNAVSILNEDGSVKDEIELVWAEGDTYYQRYDHIKTYPFTLEDQNSVTDIISFMVETRVNIDGRYDRNRGNKSNLVVSQENFNQLNEVYSQSNNVFTYAYRDPSKLDLNKWANNITWSLTKIAGDLVDKWTHITLANTLDLDGKNGKITSLQKCNDQLIAFQEKAISMIMYNENMQISATDGVPIELGNSGKVNGYRVISDTAGCVNKWSIVSTENGIYFIDGLTKNVYLFSGGKLANISDTTGMSSWFNTNVEAKEWNPIEWNDIVVYYDKLTNDIYFINSKESLAFNITLNYFTSFYSYEGTPYMVQLNDDSLAIHGNKIWKQNSGKYNMFFGKYKPYSVEVISNADRLLDKMFTNIDFRAETGNWEYNDETKLSNNWIEDLGFTFNSITATNEYQSNTEVLKYAKYGHSNLKRKFRIWRADIPRDKSAWNKYKTDRMRNPWVHIKLQMNAENNTIHDTAKTVLHDLNVTYYV